MLNKKSKKIWYGKLTTPASSACVVFDPDLPGSSPDKIHLYNAERDEIVQYVWDIVSPLLSDIDDGELKSLKKTLDTSWQKTRQQFLSGRFVAPDTLSVPKPKPVSKETEVLELPELKETLDMEMEDGFEGDYDTL